MQHSEPYTKTGIFYVHIVMIVQSDQYYYTPGYLYTTRFPRKHTTNFRCYHVTILQQIYILVFLKQQITTKYHQVSIVIHNHTLLLDTSSSCNNLSDQLPLYWLFVLYPQRLYYSDGESTEDYYGFSFGLIGY